MNYREQTIKLIVPNLRHRWTTQLTPYSDNQIAAVYEKFMQSDEFGDNDHRFPEWFSMMADEPYHAPVQARPDPRRL